MHRNPRSTFLFLTAALIAVALTGRPAGAADCTMLVQVDLECQAGKPDTLQIDTRARIGIEVDNRRPTKWKMLIDDCVEDVRTTGAIDLGSGGFDCPDGAPTEQWAKVYNLENSAVDIPDGTHSYKVVIEVRFVTGDELAGEYTAGPETHTKNCP